MNPFHQLNAWIDRTAMYHLVLGMLGILALCSVVTAFVGLAGSTGIEQVLSLVVVILSAYLMSLVCAWSTGIAANHHSSIITGLIIFFLVMPGTTILEYAFLSATVVMAIASKYILVYRGQHMVNPAAFAVVVLALSGYGVATWWVATPWLFIPLVITGTIVVMKIRRAVPVVAFLATGFLVYMFEGLAAGNGVMDWSAFWISYPALFLGFFMLTEPFTMPPTKRLQGIYGVMVGVLANASIASTFVSVTPELALLIGNVIMYPSTLRRKLFLTFESKQEIAMGTWEFIFTKPPTMVFKAGQYLEWMLPHKKADTRGIRRYFTIASAPTEETLRLALKVPEKASSFKQRIKDLAPGDVVVASQLAGDFLLPRDARKKIAMVAGGIGVTPFRSHIKTALDTYATTQRDPLDTILFYCNNTKADAAYGALWSEAETVLPFKLVSIFAKEPADATYETGYFSADIVRRRAPDFLDRTWYVSGPPPMVNATVKTLRALGVPQRKIVQDFFPGLA